MNISNLKNKIPHGGFTEIAKRCGVNKVTVSKVFNDKPAISESMKAKVLKETATYLHELKTEKESAINQIKEM